MARTKINTTVRKTIGSGGSLLITLPKRFCNTHGLKTGDELAVIYDGELLVKPNPIRTTEENKALMRQ
jgi:antitoxin component of MazEF toxin-antitoxin module